MIINKIHVDAFGALKDLTLELTDGLNIIQGENESGKSTLSAFIKFIFYGLDTKERVKYFPWDGSVAGGYIKLTHEGKDYTVRRELILLQKGAKDTVTITQDDTGAVVFKDMQPWEAFLQVNEKVFSSTVFVGQINGAYVDGAKLSDAVENILFSADEMTNTSKALKRLDEVRTSLLYKNKKGGLIYELGEKIATLEIKEAECRQANEKVFALEDSIRRAKQKKEENLKNTEELSAKLEEYEAYCAIERKQRTSELLHEAENSEKECEKLKDSLSKDGFFPDTQYVSKLYSLQSDINRYRKELEDSEEQLKLAKLELSSFEKEAETVDVINAEGGKSRVEEKLGEMKKKQKKLSTGGIICLITVVLFIVGIILLVLSNKKKKEIKEYLEKFGCETEDELLSILEKTDERENEITRRRMKIETTGARCADIRCRISDTEKEIEEETGKYKGVGEITETSVSDAAKEAQSAIDAVAFANAEFEKKYYAAQTLKKETDNIDINEMKSKIKGKLKLGDVENFDVSEQKKRLAFLQGATESLGDKLLSLEKEFSALCATVKDPAAIADELSSVRPAYAEAVSEYKACVMAYEALESASGLLREGISPKLSQLSGGFMEKLSGGKYTSVGIDGEYGMTFNENGSSHSVSAFSSGTCDLAYLCLRFALTDILYRDEKPPMIFDDTFARIDDGRLKNILSTLISMGKMKWLQPIVLTCHKREASIAGVDGVNLIKL